MEELINKLSEEEKKAIEKFKTKIKRADKDILKFSDVYTTLDIHNLRILLNLIEKQQEQLQEKDKIINEMAELIEKHLSSFWWYEIGADTESKKDIIEYFTKKAREV